MSFRTNYSPWMSFYFNIVVSTVLRCVPPLKARLPALREGFMPFPHLPVQSQAPPMPLAKAWAVLSPKPEEAFQLVTSADFIYYYNCIIPFHALNHLLVGVY